MTTTTATLSHELAHAVRGAVRTGDAPTGFQLGVPHRPQVTVAAADADDVAAAVGVAARRGVGVRVQASGHGRGAPAAGGVLLDTTALDEVTVDPHARTARLGAGATWGDVLAATGPHGLAPVSGSSPGVGAVGYTLAGGFGLLGREFGYAVDHVRALDVVTADGALRRVTAEHDADLFRVLRGGRDAAGVVTAMEIGLVEVASVLGGGLWFAADDPAAVTGVLEVLRRVLADAPDTLTVMAGTVSLPDIEAVPAAIRGHHVLHVRLVSTLAGPARAAAEQVLAALRAAGTPLVDEVHEMSWTRSGEIVGEPPWAHAYEGDAVLVTDFSAADLAALVERAGPGTGRVLDVRPLGGAFARTPDVADAVPFRDAGFVVRVISMTGPDADDAGRAAVRAAHRHVLGALGEVGDGRVLGRPAAFLYGSTRAVAAPDELRDPASLADLRRVRAARDPHGVFSGGDVR